MKRFNLLCDPWLPVTRTNQNEPEIISAYEIVKKDVLSLNAPRADFNAALMQFLIGLLQTTIAPENPRAWRNLFSQPPSEDDLRKRFEDIKDAFYLDGDSYRFMQDILSVKIGKLRPIEEMIFGAPGESGKEKNQDHFIKRKDIIGLCYSCAAQALLTANIFAEDGGSGYFQSMRGNGFVSCLVQLDERKSERSLWKNLWLNVTESNAKFTIDLKNLFYWIKDLPDKPYIERLERISSDINDLKIKKKEAKDNASKNDIDKKIEQLKEDTNKIKDVINNKEEADSLGNKKTVFPGDGIHQVFWAWMRRYLIDTKSMVRGQCSLCRNNSTLITNFYKVSKGYKYPKEEWRNEHPFSPSLKYERNQYDKNTLKYKDKMLAQEMTEIGLPYTNWQDFLIQTEKQVPANVVVRFLKKKKAEEQLVLWSFGFAMDSNSPKGWYESKTPIYLLNHEAQQNNFEKEVNRYVQAANKIADAHSGYLSVAVRMAWFGYDYEKEQEKKKDKKPDPFYNRASNCYYNHPIHIAKSFWNNTEKKFYDFLDDLYELARENELKDEKKVELRQAWYEHIKLETKSLFDRWAFTSGIENNPQRIAKAYNKLMENLNSKFLKQEVLALPKEGK